MADSPITEAEKARQRENVRQADANNAIEGLHVDDHGRALLDDIIERGLSHEEGLAVVIADLKERGVIPAEAEEGPAPLAAE